MNDVFQNGPWLLQLCSGPELSIWLFGHTLATLLNRNVSFASFFSPSVAIEHTQEIDGHDNLMVSNEYSLIYASSCWVYNREPLQKWKWQILWSIERTNNESDKKPSQIFLRFINMIIQIFLVRGLPSIWESITPHLWNTEGNKTRVPTFCCETFQCKSLVAARKTIILTPTKSLLLILNSIPHQAWCMISPKSNHRLCLCASKHESQCGYRQFIPTWPSQNAQFIDK